MTQQPPPQRLIEVAEHWKAYRPNGGGNMSDENPDPLVIPETPEAETLFIGLWDRQEKARGTDGEAIWARCCEKAKKLALVYACSRDPVDPIIDVEAATWGCDFAIWATETFLTKARDEVTDGDAFSLRRKKALRILKRKATPRSALLRALKCKAKELDEITQTLEQSGLIKSDWVEGKKGKAAQVFRVA